jgi:hypothetical protein
MKDLEKQIRDRMAMLRCTRQEAIRDIMEIQAAAAQAEQQQAVEAALEADREKALRDVFATAALGALISRSHYTSGDTNFIAERSYDFADAMMKARKQ